MHCTLKTHSWLKSQPSFSLEDERCLAHSLVPTVKRVNLAYTLNLHFHGFVLFIIIFLVLKSRFGYCAVLECMFSHLPFIKTSADLLQHVLVIKVL